MEIQGASGEAGDPAEDGEGVVGLVDAADHEAGGGAPDGDVAGVTEDHGVELDGGEDEAGGPEDEEGERMCDVAGWWGGGEAMRGASEQEREDRQDGDDEREDQLEWDGDAVLPEIIGEIAHYCGYDHGAGGVGNKDDCRERVWIQRCCLSVLAHDWSHVCA